MVDSTDIKQKYAQAVLTSLLQHWDKVDPTAGSDPAAWDKAEITSFAQRFSDDLSEEALKQFALKKDDQLRKDFEDKVFLASAQQKYIFFKMDAQAEPVSERDGLHGFNRATGDFPNTAAADQASNVIVEPEAAAPTPEAAHPPRPDLAALTRLAASSTPEPVQQPTPKRVLEPSAAPTQNPAPTVQASAVEEDNGNNNSGSVGSDQLPPQPVPVLTNTDDFDLGNITASEGGAQSDAAQHLQQDQQTPPQPAPQSATIAPTDWASIHHIFRTSDEDMARVDNAHKKGAAALGAPRGAERHFSHGSTVSPPSAVFDNVTPLTTASMAYLAVRYPSYERDPLFLEALHGLAQRQGKTVADLLVMPEIRMPTKEGERDVPMDEVIHGLHQTSSLLTTQPCSNFQRNIAEYGIMTKPWYKNFAEWMNGGVESPDALLAQYQYAGVMFVDSSKNAYIDTGKNVKVILAPREKFGAEHAFNVTRVFMSGRFNPSGAISQTLKFDLSGGNWKSRVQHPKMVDENLSLMVISTLAECERAGGKSGIDKVIPEIRVHKLRGMTPLHRILLQEDIDGGQVAGPNDIVLNKTAREEMTMRGIKVTELVRKFNARDYKTSLTIDSADRPTISSPDPVISNSVSPSAHNGNGNGNGNSYHYTVPDFTDISAIAKAGIGKLTEMVLGTDLSKALNRTAELQSEMMAIDKVMQDRNDSPEYRKAFIDHYNANIEEGRNQVKNVFTSEEIDAANTALRDNLNNIQNLKGPGTSVVPAFGAILQNVLTRSDQGSAPMDPAQIKKYFEAGAMLQFAARITQALTTGDAKDFAYPRASDGDSKSIALAGQAFALLKNQLDNGTLDTRFASKLVQTDIKQMVREVQMTLKDMHDPRVASLGTLFMNSLNALADRYKASAPRQQHSAHP